MKDQASANGMDGKNFPSPDHGSVPSDTFNPDKEETRLFRQVFELEGDWFFNFQNCNYNAKCTVFIDYLPEPIQYLCPVIDPSKLPPYYFPPVICYDNSNQNSCIVEAVINENGTMILSKSKGQKADECLSFEGSYQYAVVACQGLDQKKLECGTGQQKYDLIFNKL